MTTTIRTAITDADYEAWRAVRIAVLPYERCPTSPRSASSTVPAG